MENIWYSVAAQLSIAPTSRICYCYSCIASLNNNQRKAICQFWPKITHRYPLAFAPQVCYLIPMFFYITIIMVSGHRSWLILCFFHSCTPGPLFSHEALLCLIPTLPLNSYQLQCLVFYPQYLSPLGSTLYLCFSHRCNINNVILTHFGEP